MTGPMGLSPLADAGISIPRHHMDVVVDGGGTRWRLSLLCSGFERSEHMMVRSSPLFGMGRSG